MRAQIAHTWAESLRPELKEVRGPSGVVEEESSPPEDFLARRQHSFASVPRL